MLGRSGLAIGAFGIAACGTACLTQCAGAESLPSPPQSVPVVEALAQRQDVPIVLNGLGTVQALNTATIHVQVQLCGARGLRRKSVSDQSKIFGQPHRCFCFKR
jgi:multidrug efflux pump subunit AcrA (membrane-fusion protein)